MLDDPEMFAVYSGVAALTAWLFLREPLVLLQVAGGLVILAGIALAGGLFRRPDKVSV